ncbi:MAG: glycosyltransferase [Planctomycetota bacterium]
MRPESRVGYVLIGRNEGKRLQRALRAIDCGRCPVVYVDSGSTDDSVAFAHSIGADVVDLDTSAGFTAARARNAGARRLFDIAPDVEFVQFIDGDCELRPGYIGAALETLDTEPDIAVVSGRRRERSPEASTYNALIDLEWDTPVGEVKACHGDATVRRSAFEGVGGFRDTMIAGEEPEMCVRLRQAGWRLRRIDREMTLHDADLTRWGQWWKRSVRAGHAYAEGAMLHGRSSARHNVGPVKSIAVWTVGWAIALAAAIAVAAFVWSWAWMGVAVVALMPAAMALKVAWSRRRRGDVPFGLALAYGLTCVVGKWANAAGVLTYLRRRGRRGPVRLIEYKAAERTARQGPTVAYVASVLPKRSETFVYRELLGLRGRGASVLPVSLYAPEQALGDDSIDAIAAEAVTVYARGWPRLIIDAGLGLATSLGAWRALAMGWTDALASGESIGGRGKALVQSVAGVALARRLRRIGVDHLHAHFAHAPASIAMYAAAATGVPFSFTGHAADLFRDAHLLPTKLRRAAFVACISEWHRAHYQALFKRDDAEYPIVRCGVALSPATPAPHVGPPRLATVARLVPKKGIDTLVAALPEIRRRHADTRLVIGGDGPQLAALREQADRLGVVSAIDFRGALQHADVPALLAEADIFVLPCQPAADGDRDGIPVALMEAMAAGVAVVSGDLPTIRELIADGQTGRLVAPGSDDAVADAVKELLDDPDTRACLAAAGRERVATEFTDGVNLDRLIVALERALGRPIVDPPSQAVITDIAQSTSAHDASQRQAIPKPALATTT